MDGEDAKALEDLAAFCESKAKWCLDSAECIAKIVAEHPYNPDAVKSPQASQPQSCDASTAAMIEELIDKICSQQAQQTQDEEQTRQLLDIAAKGGAPAQKIVSTLLQKLQETRRTLNGTTEQEGEK